ncbi:hypothetical protein BCR35DRAFT_298172 [Leucosporidium creatinivorum]|uniref:UBR-type domain-containing protein n=1 Tax=Leucosporidium creatinivorum TaxID=106004 RepID=A0A1Y2G409_9BASI|nr:hypothetical protein BCR35DRAFT_298172 [Leucosporidium creatinivorum]
MTLTHNDLLFSPTRDGVPSSDDNFTANDLVAAQDALETEAREVLGETGNQCTYDLGYIKQPLYACLTCLNNCAVCAACSVACHGDHDLVELFNRRDFQCECGTRRMGAGSFCSLSPRTDAPISEGNRHDKNFRNEFCICGRLYDPATETDSMYQCIVCEDWLHHECLLGSHSDLNDAPLGPDDFDQIICDGCVKTNRHGVRSMVLERYAGRKGTGVMVIGGEGGREVLGRAILEDDDQEVTIEMEAAATAAPADATSTTTEKRKADSPKLEGDLEPAPKKLRTDNASTSKLSSSTPSILPSTASVLPTPSAESSQPPAVSAPPSAAGECKAPLPFAPGEVSPLMKLESEGRKLNVYLEEGWMMRWCRCSKCAPSFYDLPYFLEEEEVYEPPEDPDAQKSTLELGMEALARMPREQAIEGAMAFQGLSERLKAYLRPLAATGTTITKEIIDEFFEREKEARGQAGAD